MKVEVRVRALAPIAHSSFGPSTGNAVLFRRLPLADGSIVPAVSGNALRGMLRRIAMRDLLSSCGLDNTTPGWDALYAALANGGHLQGSETSLEPQYVSDLRRRVPPLSLFGAALRTWMLAGKMRVGILWPRCVETRAAGLVTDEAESIYPLAESLLDDVSHVRHVDREHQNPEATGVTPMPTTIETLRTGTVLESRINLDGNCTPEEVGVLADAIGRLQFIGGKSSAGLGAVSVEHDASSFSSVARWKDRAGAVEDAADALKELAERLESKITKKGKGKGRAATASDS